MTNPQDRSYDADVPNKTIYVSDGDLKIYQQAQDLAGGNLSSAITRALRRYVDIEEGKLEGFEEITVKVGIGTKRKVRFSGLLLATWTTSTSSRQEIFQVFRSRKGKYVLHIDRTAEWTMVDGDGKPAGWRGHLGLGNVSYGAKLPEATIEVLDTVDELREKIPPQLYAMVASSGTQPAIEDLDI